MITTNPTIDRITGKLSDQSLLFRYTIKLVLIVSFSELILYRLVSRLGMHLSKLAQEHEWIVPTFTVLTQIGQWLLNVVAILLFLALSVAAIGFFSYGLFYVVRQLPPASAAPRAGQKAPDFTLPDQNGKAVTLAALLGSEPNGAAGAKANGALLIFYRGHW